MGPDPSVAGQQDMQSEPLKTTNDDDTVNNNKQTSAASRRGRKRRSAAMQLAGTHDRIHNMQRNEEPTAPKRRRCQSEVYVTNQN